MRLGGEAGDPLAVITALLKEVTSMARRGGRLTKEWVHSLTSIDALTGDGTNLEGSIAFAIPGTVLRMLGEYIITPSAATAAGDRAVISVGVGFVSTDAATLGSTAMPDPESDVEYPWLYWGSHPMFFGSTSADPNSAGASVRVNFDVKSMRRFKPTESLVTVIQYGNSAGAPPLEFIQAPLRVLIGT